MSKSKHGPAAAFSGASNGRTIAPAKHIQCEETIPSIEPITSPRGISSSSVGPVEVPDLSTSPYRIGASFKLRDNTDISVIKSPSSPMLTAMREAVDSITQYEDFEVVEKIGAGFYADVFKVMMKSIDTAIYFFARKPLINVSRLRSCVCNGGMCLGICAVVMYDVCVRICVCICIAVCACVCGTRVRWTHVPLCALTGILPCTSGPVCPNRGHHGVENEQEQDERSQET